MNKSSQGDALTGAALTSAEETDYAAWADRAAREEFSPAVTGGAYEGDEATREARDLLDDIIGSDELDRAIGRGRPALGGRAGSGPSPKRQVRLPQELDELLTERAAAEHRKPSDVMRDALNAYLRAS